MTPKEKGFKHWEESETNNFDAVKEAIDVALLTQAKEIFRKIEDYWAGSEKYLDITEQEFNKIKKKFLGDE